MFERSSTGRYYLAVYANYDGDFRVSTMTHGTSPQTERVTDSYFLEEVAKFLTTTATGQIVLAVIAVLCAVLCCGCCCTMCCSHEDLHKADSNKLAGMFGRIISSNGPRMTAPSAPPAPPPIDPVQAAMLRAEASHAMAIEMAGGIIVGAGEQERQRRHTEVTNPMVRAQPQRGRRSMI